jgi:hypothetical protein
VAQAKADLAQRLGVAPEDIQVIRAEAVTWPNAALGCPQPDMSYADVLVEGLLVELSHGGQVYSYHSGGTEPPFLCEQAGSLDQATPTDGSGLLTPPSPA